MQMFNDILEEGKSKLNSITNEIVFLNNHIELYLNPTEVVSKN